MVVVVGGMIRMLISYISAAGKIYIQVKISEQDCALLGRID